MKLKKFIVNLIFFIGSLLLYTLIDMAFIFATYLISRNFKFSASSFWQFNYMGDWLILIITVALLVLGIFLIAKQIYANTKNEYQFSNFVYGNGGAMLFVSAFLFMISASISPLKKYTASSIKSIADYSNFYYILGYILITLMTIYMLYISRNWIKRNNWYLIGTLIMPLVYIRCLLISHNGLNTFLHEKTTTYSELAKMFNVNNNLDLTIINGTAKVSMLFMLFTFFVLVMIGGLLSATKNRKKWIEKIEEKG